MFSGTASLAFFLVCSPMFCQNQSFCFLKIVLIKKECVRIRHNIFSLYPKMSKFLAKFSLEFLAFISIIRSHLLGQGTSVICVFFIIKNNLKVVNMKFTGSILQQIS